VYIYLNIVEQHLNWERETITSPFKLMNCECDLYL